ncbi:MAG: peptidase M3, partial [Planctomycetota bacterium]
MNTKQTLMRTVTAGMIVMAAGCATPGARRPQPEAPGLWSLDATPLDRTPEELTVQTTEHLAWAKALRDRIVEVTGPRTIENTLVPYNRMMMHLDASRNEGELLAAVHPDPAVREAAEETQRRATKMITELKLDRELYEAFAALDVSHADAETRFVVEKILREFRRAGVDKPEEVRKRIARLNDEILKTGQTFARNIRDDIREIVLDSPADLAGLPADWIEKHKPGKDGKIHVTTQYPDYIPFMTYAKNADARRELYLKFRNRGYPQNLEVLDTLIAKRYELARLLGYDNWADYVTEDKMIESGENARKFIDRIAKLARGPAQRDYAVLLERKRKDVPGATSVADWEKDYYANLVRTEKFAFDPQSVRPYFNFVDVRDGLFKLTQELFGVTYRQVHGLNLWHPDVTAWDVYDKDRCIGRFYLDLHPRPGKYSHAAQFDYRTGIRGVRLPQAVLVCNFPDPRKSPEGLALMEHDEVVTFFHEFGHLLHAIFSGHNRWIGSSGISTEWDFVEAPSQMLEHWCYNADALRTFARHYQTGEPIPVDLVEKLRKASDFGKALHVAHQMFYAAVSLNYYNRDPKDLDTTGLMVELQKRYSPFDYVEGTHFQCSFGHLDQYSAIYYTYMWSLVIAKDLFSRFEKEGVLNPRTARDYRRAVLEPGGSKKAADLVA